jgi:hypothetical protein
MKPSLFEDRSAGRNPSAAAQVLLRRRPVTNPNALVPLMRMVPLSQILLGSDFPYRPCLDPVAGLAGCDLSASQHSAIGRQNALRLMTRFA